MNAQNTMLDLQIAPERADQARAVDALVERAFGPGRYAKVSERLRELAESGSYDDDAWAEIVGLGWPGIAVSEQHGGQGLGLIELVILQEELGYALAPVPFLSNTAAALMLEHAGSGHADFRYMRRLLVPQG